MSGLFYGCSSLTSLPDISKFSCQNLTHSKNIFLGCYSLISLPNLSKFSLVDTIYTSNDFIDVFNSLNQFDSIAENT